ncbi:MAG TPA: M48 family metallopeptidase [Bacteroidia bacterium]|nr:M48 family metallopeptidase [Bacteroidia bacterium]
MNLTIVIVVLLLASFVFERVLDRLNSKSWDLKLPESLSDLYKADEYEKAQRYDQEKDRLSMWSSAFSLLLMITLVYSRSFAWLLNYVSGITTDLMFQTILFFGIFALLSDLLQLPFSIYSTFVIEEKFGFNRTTPKTFILDKFKGYLLAATLGGSVIALFVLFYQYAGSSFWWIAWVSISGFSLLISMFYASVILPIFNKLSPLPQGDLRDALTAYCKKVNFPVSDLFVMDGSKRSSKANAFFSGLGPKKKIVLFDTLIEKHSVNELVAVMAHEVGHYKKKHTFTMIGISILQTGLMMFILGKFINTPDLSIALGAEKAALPLGLIAFFLLYSPVSMFLSIGMNMLSRKHEYEADNFASETANASDLVNALKKLSKDSLSNLNPHPAYVFVYYSHPTLLQRMNNMHH